MPTIFSRGAASALAFGWSRIAAVLDPYFQYVSMLLPGNGTNAAQNNTFLDSSVNNFTITRNGNTTQGTFSPYGTNWSVFFDGTGDYVSVPANANFLIGTNNFTMEFWISASRFSATGVIVSHQLGGMFKFDMNAAGKMVIGVNPNGGTVSAYSSFTTTTSLTLGGWTHVAIVRNGTEVACYFNGVKDATTLTLSPGTNIGSFGGNKPIYIGAGADAASVITGYMSNVRYVVGTAVYTSNFTPSTTPLTAISNTKLLTCQSNRFIDNSGNGYTVTPVNDSSVQRYGPFNPTASYSTGTEGGSGYFDGTGDYLNAGSSSNLDNFTGDFCLEAWIYPTTSADQNIIARWTTGTRSYRMFLTVTTNYIRIRYNNDTINLDSTTAVRLNAWNHVVANRSGSTLTLFLNGTSVSTATSSATIVASTSTFIGATETASPQAFFYGYIADARIVKGSSVYGTSNFTPPTAPLTAVANTQLLLSMTNAGIIDNAMINNLETVGNAQISATQSKFGGTSIYLDGTGDWLVAPNRANLNFAFVDFTVEAWVYTSSTSQQCVIGSIQNTNGAGSWMWTLNYNSNKLRFFCRYNAGTVLDYQANAGSFPTNTWTHIAVTRNGANLRMFIDGTQVGTTNTTLSTLTIDNASANYRVGSTTDNALAFNGYINDLRVTKGYARYTANFTPPTTAFPIR